MGAALSAIWIGNPFFQPALADCGWRTHLIDPAPGEVLGWEAITDAAGFVPDVVVVADKSLPPFVTGMEKFPCLTAFYAVDTHIHSWFPYYAQGFDLCLVSLRDHMPLFYGARLAEESVLWSPPYAYPRDVPQAPDHDKPLWDVLFLGTANPAVNPERCAFLDALGKRVPGLHITQSGHRAAMYAQAKLVLNHAIAGDLNFRVFEALGCGACLVTPQVRHGFDDLFKNGVDLFVYDPADVPALADLIHTLLASPEHCQKVAAQGHAAVLAGHYMRHRAETFTTRVTALTSSGKAKRMVATRLDDAKNIHAAWLKLIYLHHAETAESPIFRSAYLKAAKN